MNDEEMADFNLLIPARPDGSEPVLQRGYTWLRTDWIAYWLFTYSTIDNRKENLNLPCSRIRATYDVLLWCRENPRTKDIFQTLLKAERPEEREHLWSEWLASSVSEIEALRGEFIFERVADRGNLSRAQILQEYLGDPISISSDTLAFAHGRHRAYAAWHCGLPTFLVWIS